MIGNRMAILAMAAQQPGRSESLEFKQTANNLVVPQTHDGKDQTVDPAASGLKERLFHFDFEAMILISFTAGIGVLSEAFLRPFQSVHPRIGSGLRAPVDIISDAENVGVSPPESSNAKCHSGAGSLYRLRTSAMTSSASLPVSPLFMSSMAP